jgi:ABC-type polysaccharide/polyol phosphate transport system ATPase subunit
MYLKLAFSIAIHSEADIYLFDEVVAVGDLAFQQKCIEKILELQKQQKTVIFVSHDDRIIKRLAQRIIAIDKGKLLAGEQPISG